MYKICIGSLCTTSYGLFFIVAVVIFTALAVRWISKWEATDLPKNLAFYRAYEPNNFRAHFKLHFAAHDEGMGCCLPVDESTGKLTRWGKLYLSKRGLSENDWREKQLGIK